MCRRINPGFHYSWGTDRENSTPEEIRNGMFEMPHVSFPVEASMDRIVITKPPATPPILGQGGLHETNASIKRRRKMGAGSVDWNLQDTYSMCLWSAYFDWISWKSMNVPAVRPFSLSQVTGSQPVYLSVYELPNVTPQEYKKKKKPLHRKCEIKVYTRLEFSHSSITSTLRKKLEISRDSSNCTEMLLPNDGLNGCEELALS